MKYWANLGAKVKLGVPCAGDYDIVVFDDYVVEIYWPRKFLKDIDRIYKLRIGGGLVFGMLYTSIFSVFIKFPVNITVLRNKKIASQIRKETLAYFR